MKDDARASLPAGNTQEYTYSRADETVAPMEPDLLSPPEELEEQQGHASSLALRFLLSLFVTCVLFYLDFAGTLHFPLPAQVSPGDNGLGFAAANLLLLLLDGALCFHAAYVGLWKVFALRADADSLTSLAFYGAAAGCGFLMAQPAFVEERQAFVVAASAGACVTLNLLGRLLLSRQVCGNLRLVSDCKRFLAAHPVDTGDLEEHTVRTLRLTDGIVCSLKHSVELTDFMESANAPSVMDGAAKWLSPVLLLGALGASAFVWVGTQNPMTAANVFAIACCLSVPAAPVISAGLPLLRACRKLRRNGALLTGPDTVRQFSALSAFVLDIRTVFPKGTVSLSSVKPCVSRRIDTELIDAASIACASGGPLGDVFLSLLGSTRLLRPVGGFETFDGCGVCGWVGGRRVLLGNRELMRRYKIEPPSHDYEAHVATTGDDLVYLAVEGELVAVLVVRYEADKDTARALRRLQKFGVTLLIDTSDPNITVTMLSERFKLETHGIQVLSSSERALFHSGGPDRQVPAGLAFTKPDAGACAAAATACIKLQGTFSVTTVIQITGALLGSGFMVFAAVAGAASQVNALQTAAFQLIWALPVLLISLLRKH